MEYKVLDASYLSQLFNLQDQKPKNKMPSKDGLTDREKEQLKREQERKEEQMRRVGRWFIFTIFSINYMFLGQPRKRGKNKNQRNSSKRTDAADTGNR